MTSARARLFLASIAALGGCIFTAEDPATIGGSVRVEGRLVDLATRQPIAGTASLTTSGLAASPLIEVDGAAFVLDKILEHSVFHVQAAVPPSHHATSSAIEVASADLDDVAAPVISEELLGRLATGFGVTPSTARGVLLARVVDAAGQPRAGITAQSFALDGGGAARGPFFLDAAMAPAPGATATSASGWVVFFEVVPGVVGLGTAAAATVTFDMPVSPIAAGVVTVVSARAIDGMFVPPKDVSFARQVFPIFSRRGCVACHAAGNGPGREQGGLTLNDDQNNVYRELVEETSTRVVVAAPETSLVLRMPSREDPPDAHPNVTFTSMLDPDYQLLRVWISEGARKN